MLYSCVPLATVQLLSNNPVRYKAFVFTIALCRLDNWEYIIPVTTIAENTRIAVYLYIFDFVIITFGRKQKYIIK